MDSRTIQEDFRLMVDAVSDYAIFLVDVHGCIRTWNAGARAIKGYQADEVLGRHIRLFYPDEVAASGWPEHELLVASQVGRFEDEGWRLRKDGSRFWANIIITRLVDDDGVFHGFSKITRDLTERRQHEDMLRHSEERFRLLVEGVKDYAIFMLDPEGRVASWNIGAQRTKGYLGSEIIGQHFSVFYPPRAKAVPVARCWWWMTTRIPPTPCAWCWGRSGTPPSWPATDWLRSRRSGSTHRKSSCSISGCRA